MWRSLWLALHATVGICKICVWWPKSVFFIIFIRPESDHWQCWSWLIHSLTAWLTHSPLVNLIDVTLAHADGYSKLVEVVTVVEVDDEKHVDKTLVQIWKVNFGHKVKFLFGLWGRGFKICSRFWSQCSGTILKLTFGHYFAADVDDKDRDSNSLLQILNLRFDHKT